MVKVVSFRFQHCLSHLIYCLSKGPLKRDFLKIYLTTFFGIRNFRRRSAMDGRLFFLKCSKFFLNFENAEENSKKPVCFFK